MGGSKPSNATATGVSARRRKSKPRSRPASAARGVPLTSASHLIFGRRIGEGTQGEVRLARHATTGKRYVVKILDLDQDSDDVNDTSLMPSSNVRVSDAKRQASSLTDEEATAVETEADCLRMLSHPNVVRCHGSFRLDPTDDDALSRRHPRLCIVMSHCEGGDLATLLARTKGQPLPEDAVMRWLVQLLLALDHVHSKHTLHRDLKPANVFLSKNLRCVKIGDFGIAKTLERRDDLAVTRVGTPLYMSPELIAGQPYTYASDVWALGCIAYELASGGVRAFESDSLPQLMCKVMTGDYPPVPSHFSRQFERIVAAMLDPDPHERPTAGALLRHPFVRTHCEAWLAESSSSSPRDTTRGHDGDPAETRTESNKSNEPNNKPAARSSSVSPRNHQLVLPPLDPVAIEDAAARASRSIAAVARKVRVSEASSRTVRKKTNGPGAAAPPHLPLRRPPSRVNIERERLRAVEARYAARQRHARESRAAVREHDPARIERRRRAEEAAATRLAEQDARRVASAEEALLRHRGLVYAREGEGEEGAEEGADTAVQDGTVDGDTRERVGSVAFTSRPLLDRTDPGVCPADPAEDVGEECELEVPSVEATAELMEALMAEARDDYKESKEEEEDVEVEEEKEEEKEEEEPGESVSALERELELCFADVDERIRVLHRLWHASGGNRRRGIGTAPSGASRDASGDVPVASASVEWPLPPLPPVESSSSGFGGDMQERERDVQLERHVRAKLRSFIRASVELEQSISDSRPASAVGNNRGGDRSSVSFSGWATAGAVGLLRTDRGAEGTSGSFDSDLDGYVESCLVSSDDEVGDE